MDYFGLVAIVRIEILAFSYSNRNAISEPGIDTTWIMPNGKQLLANPRAQYYLDD